MKQRFAILILSAVLILAAAPSVSQDGALDMKIQGGETGPTVNPNIYGHFAEHLGHCIYEGIWVGPESDIPNIRGIRIDTLEALRAIDIPVLRWPGGCFADEYHWRDGIGPRHERPSMINTHWGGVVENNHFGTHEFMDLVEMLECEAFISGNVGSGTVQETMEWVEYLTSDADSPIANLRRENGREEPWSVKYWGVGNETWGCGGNMRPEYYADVYRRYNTFIKNYPGNRIERIACGPSGGDYHWTEVMMDRIGARRMDGMSLHHYTIPTGNWGRKGPSIGFEENQYFSALRNTLLMDEYITKHSEIMDRTDPRKRVGIVVDEWGIWTDPDAGTNPGFLRQQNSMRDAIIAGLNFHIFHEHADRVTMANIAQTINVLQAMLLTDGERMVKTPTYWVFEMYKGHQGGVTLPVEFESPDYNFDNESIPAISASATRNADTGKVLFSIVNTNPEDAQSIDCALEDIEAGSATGRVLTADAFDAHNTFDAPETVAPAAFTDFSIADGRLMVTVPAKSVVTLAF